MSVYHPPVRARRVEPALLGVLRAAMPGIRFATVRDRSNPSRECVLVAEPAQLATPVTQYARLRVTVWERRDDGTGDWQKAQETAAQIEELLTGGRPPRPVVTVAHESGPIRMTDGDGCACAYLVLLLTVETN